MGRFCWIPSRWALNHAFSLANSQHKYPRRNTGVTLGSTIFQSRLCLGRLPNTFISGSRSLCHIFSSRYLLVHLFSFLYLLLSCLLYYAVCFPLFVIFLFFLTSRPVWITHSVCLSLFCFVSISLAYTLHPLFVFPLSGSLPQFLVFTPWVSGWPVVWALAQACPTAICQRLLISHQHVSFSPSLASLTSCQPLPSACLSPVTYGSFHRVLRVSKSALITDAHLALISEVLPQLAPTVM